MDDSSNANNASTLVDSNTTSISLSFTPISTPTSSPDTSNPANVSMQIPDGGGIAAGGHTVTVNTGSDIASYELALSSKTEETALVNEDNKQASIPAISQQFYYLCGLDAFTSLLQSNAPDMTWAYGYEFRTIPSSSGIETCFGYISGMSASSNPTLIGTGSTGTNNEHNVYYGAKVDHPASTPAGNYTAQVVYSVTAKLQEPVLTNIEPNTYELGSNESNTITITGKYLSTASKAYLTNTDTSADNSGTQYDCTNLQLLSNDANGNTTLTCNIPTDTTNPAIDDPGTYSLTIETEGGTTTREDAITYTKPSICRNSDPDSDCQVDIDDNMIPIAYDGYDGNGGGNWRIVTKEEIDNNKGSWYDYGNKQWANAITLRDDYEGGCYFFRKDLLPERVVFWTGGDACYDDDVVQHYTPLELAKMIRDEPDTFISLDNANSSLFNNDVSDGTSATEIILGYWVYIPRYAYEVQRRDAIDRVVDPQNFGIVFQTTNQKNMPATTCSTTSSHKDYRAGCGVNGTYIANSNNTTWATHPAFNWGTEETGYTELNGIWVGKFEMTGTRTAPTVKPNQHANIYEQIGNFYSMARSIGYPDSNNVGGGSLSNDPTDSLTQNSHHLAKATSHMLKNSEWGAITYLAHSKYGAGINTGRPYDTNVDKNGAYSSGSKDADNDSSAYGITGCGPVSAGSTSYYPYDNNVPAGTTLDADTIESPTACSTDTRYAYNGEIGVLASTTNTVYGIYDVAGGTGEYVMGNKTTSDTQSGGSTSYMKTPAQPPYVDLYKSSSGFGTKPSWSSGPSEYYYNYDVCTFETCGGTATYETTDSKSYQSWGGTNSNFVNSGYPWFFRGSYSNRSDASPFYTSDLSGVYNPFVGSRAALLALPDGQ